MLKFFKGLGIIVGLIFGAGIFALPFAIARAGVLWGVIHLLIATSLIVLLLFLYAEVAYNTEGKHRFTGYVDLILGKKAKFFAFLVTIFSYYGTLLIYGVLGGIFLSDFLNVLDVSFFSKENTFILSLLFFVVGSVLVFLELDKIALINFYLTIPLVGFVFYLVYSSVSFVDLANFPLTLNGFSVRGGWFIPYGVWLFSLGGFAAIPEARDIYSKDSLKSLKKVILTSVMLCVFLYCLFIFSILGVSGLNTSPDAFAGVFGILDSRVIAAGSVMGLLAVFTSFLSIGVDLRGVYRFDFGFSKILAWFFVVVPPAVLFSLGFQDFTLILSLVGSVGLGFVGIIVILMARKLRKEGVIKKGVKIGVFMEVFVSFAILAAVIYEIYSLFF